MNQTAAQRHPWKALAAVGAMLVVVHGARAATPEAEPVRVQVVGQLPLHEACPAVDADLPAALTAAWDDADKPSIVTVTFKVRHHAIFDVVPQSDSARMVHRIRRAVRGLSCGSSDDQAHVVQMLVRFVDGADGSHVATLDAIDVASAR